jgi:hypothetical protein
MLPAPIVPDGASGGSCHGRRMGKSNGDVFGRDDDMELAGVDLDEFCFQEPTQQLSTEEFRNELLRKSKLQTENSKQRYTQIMMAC